MAWNSEEAAFTWVFDDALVLRDAGMLDLALGRLEEVIAGIRSGEGRLLAHAHIQAARIFEKRNNPLEAERHLRLATEAWPRLELASLGLFHALLALGRNREAISEVIRFAALGGFSEDFDMLMASDDFLPQLSDEERELARVARQLLRVSREGPGETLG